MIKKLTKHGNSYAMVIEKPILELLRITPETSFEIVTDGKALILTPIRDHDDEQKIDDALAMVHECFGDAMRELAK